jgi:hypothetical protein
MFLSLDLKTDDIVLWAKIDQLLADEFGLTHVIWGVDTTNNNKPTACKLPETLWTSSTNLPARDFCLKVKEKIKTMWSGPFIIMTIPGDGWSHDTVRGNASYPPYNNLDIESRIE